MRAILPIVFGLIGLILGYNIQLFCKKIIFFKIKEDNIFRLLSSNYLRLLLSSSLCVIWWMSVLNIDNIVISILICLQITLGIIISLIDICIKKIPNELVLTLIILGIVYQTISYGINSLLPALLCMVFIMVLFIITASLVGFGKVGAGDVKLAGAMGIALGYPLIERAIFIMAGILITFIVIGLIVKKIKINTMLPFAPFIMVGFIGAFFSVLV